MVLDWDADGRDDLLVDWSDGKWRALKCTATGPASPIAAGSGDLQAEHWMMLQAEIFAAIR